MKGISTIIATILLLLIVIAIVGYSFGFFQQFFGQATSTGTQQLTDVQNALQKSVRIEAASSTSFTVRNTGSVTLTKNEIAAFVNNNIATCTWVDPTAPIPANNLSTCNSLLPVCNSGSTLRVTTAGLSDEFDC